MAYYAKYYFEQILFKSMFVIQSFQTYLTLIGYQSRAYSISLRAISKSNRTRSYTADAVLYRQPSGQPTNTVMLNLNWLSVEEVSWQWSVGRVTVPRLSTWYDVTWYDMTWHDGERCDMTWHDVTWHDVTWGTSRGMMTWRDMTSRKKNCVM